MPKLLEQVRTAIRVRHYSYRTEKTYIHWIKQYIFFNNKQHPAELGPQEVSAFLSHLAVGRKVAAATQNQALAAILFLYRNVLKKELPWLENIERAKQPSRLPLVFTRAEVGSVLSHLNHTNLMMASLLYGSGLRLQECLSLRVKDLDFQYKQLVIRQGKGAKDRITMLPISLIQPLRQHLLHVKALHQRDLREGVGPVYLPDALAIKFPNAGREWSWQYVFPAAKPSRDPISGIIRRHHVGAAVLQRAIKGCVLQASTSREAVTLFVIVLQRTCWKTATISERSKSYSGIRT